MPRPDEATYNALASFLENELDRAAAAKPNPGRPLIRRLNRSEYANAIRDLLTLEVDVSSLLPPDDSAFGFDNISDMLGTSPALLERYLVAADRVSALAVGAAVAPGSDTYRVRQDRSQDQHIEGLPLGTVGGLVVNHTFPLDAEYRFSLALYRNNLEAIRGLEHPHQIEITVDGERVFLDDGRRRDARRGASGREHHRAQRCRRRATSGGRAGEGWTPRGGRQLRAQDWRGHAAAAAVSSQLCRHLRFDRTPAHRDAHDCRAIQSDRARRYAEPAAYLLLPPFGAQGVRRARGRVDAVQEEACATRIISTLARRAYRRPVTKADTSRLLTFYRAGRAKGELRHRHPDGAPSAACEPDLRLPRGRGRHLASRGRIQRVSDFELASRLSFFLWSSIPDDALLDLARRGQLRKPAVLEREVRRMIADPKADSFVRNFTGQWLHTRNLRTVMPNHDEFPDFDDTLRDAFQTEAELFFESIVRGDRNVLDLLTADYTFVNERLAKHYGIPYVYGSHFRRVTLTDDARRGLLGQGRSADGDVAGGPDGTGAARQMDSRERPGHAAATAAGQRASARGKCRRGAAHTSGAHGDGTAPARPARAATG